MIAPPPQDTRRGTGFVMLLIIGISLFLAAPRLAPAIHQFQSQGDFSIMGVADGLLAIGKGVNLPELPAIGGTPKPNGKAGTAVGYALAQRGKPYRYGAAGPNSFDCSGLTMVAWRHAGVSIPRTAAGQLAGLPRVPRSKVKPGDLLVYNSPRSPSGRHVVMYVGGGRVVEASGRGVPVRTTSAGARGGFIGAVRPGR